ncbi:MAG: phosphate ABC transporter permease subunit PstC [Candidatus Delongbacteria bacterium]|nr:phosphate ABC transporter permease subunit PstC [Candidatus Delongbacteria bacterium]
MKRLRQIKLIGFMLAGNGLIWLSLAILAAILCGLIWRSYAIFGHCSLSEILFSQTWMPTQGKFGLAAFITGTFMVSGLAMILAVPISLLTAIYLSEYIPLRLSKFLQSIIDLLAGIPSVIYGIWGILVIIPLIKNHLAPLAGSAGTGYSLLAGGIVLAVMVFPVIIQISLEVFRSIPFEIREVSMALGATQWETIKRVILRKAMPGLVAANILGLSRALGETMAVMMVVGNVAKIPHSLFDPAYPLPALIANTYGEMMSIPLYDSAVMTAALVLLMIVVIFNILARIVLKNLRIGY